MRWYYWILSGCVALFFHAGVLAAIFYQPTDKSSSNAVGIQGVEFDLGMLGDLTVSEAVANAQKVEEKVVEEIEEPIEEPVEEIEPEPEPEPVVEPEPEPIVEVKQEALAIEKVVVKKKEEPKPKPEEPKKEEIKKPEPKKEVVKAPEPDPVFEAVNNVKEDSVASIKQAAGVGNSVNAGAAAEVQAEANYLALLRAKIYKNHIYPKRAKRRSIEGNVLIYLEINRDGSLKEYNITKSSGNILLDRAAIKAITSSSPFPPFTKDMTNEWINFTVPLEYELTED